jgi:hypothetical protein
MNTETTTRTKRSSEEVLTAVLAALINKADQTTEDLVEVLGLSESRTRELLSAFVKAKKIGRKHVDQDGRQVFAYFAPSGAADEILDMTPSKPAKAGKKAKAAKAAKSAGERKPRKKSDGRGNPNGEHVINPQHTLELKKTAIKELGGKMSWGQRTWNITVNGKTEQVASRDMARMSVEALIERFK